MKEGTHVDDPSAPDNDLDARAVPAALIDFGPGRSKLFGNSADEHSRCTTVALLTPTSRRARVASGNASTTTGPIRTASS